MVNRRHVRAPGRQRPECAQAQAHAMTTRTTENDAPTASPPDLVRRGAIAELRRHRPADRDDFVRWYQDADIAELLRHDLEPLTAIQARGYFETIVLPASARGTAWAIHDRVSGNLLGSTAVTDVNDSDGTCLFRIVIGEKQAWGHGFGTDATRLVVAEAFETLQLRAVRLEVFAHNLRARRAYARVGFRETGQQVEWVPRRRRQLHVIAMELDRNRWRAMQDTTTEPGHDEAPQ
jgi:RimJ/RimL family protein N-acetyltransferase